MCLYISLQTCIYIYTYFEDSVHFPLLSWNRPEGFWSTENPTPSTHTLNVAPSFSLRPLGTWEVFETRRCLLSVMKFQCPFSLNHHTVLENIDEVVSTATERLKVVGLICCESMWFSFCLSSFSKEDKDPSLTAAFDVTVCLEIRDISNFSRKLCYWAYFASKKTRPFKGPLHAVFRHPGIFIPHLGMIIIGITQGLLDAATKRHLTRSNSLQRGMTSWWNF